LPVCPHQPEGGREKTERAGEREEEERKLAKVIVGRGARAPSPQTMTARTCEDGNLVTTLSLSSAARSEKWRAFGIPSSSPPRLMKGGVRAGGERLRREAHWKREGRSANVGDG